MSDLADETAALQANLEGVDEIQSALHTFDESFSMFLYGLKMNAFCVEWPEVSDERLAWGTAAIHSTKFTLAIVFDHAGTTRREFQAKGRAQR